MGRHDRPGRGLDRRVGRRAARSTQARARARGVRDRRSRSWGLRPPFSTAPSRRRAWPARRSTTPSPSTSGTAPRRSRRPSCTQGRGEVARRCRVHRREKAEPGRVVTARPLRRSPRSGPDAVCVTFGGRLAEEAIDVLLGERRTGGDAHGREVGALVDASRRGPSRSLRAHRGRVPRSSRSRPARPRRRLPRPRAPA